MAYLDTSILGSYYCAEPLSATVNRALLRLDLAVISPIGELEFSSLLSLKVRTGALDRPSAVAALSLFRRHLAGNLYRVVEPDPVAFITARRWLARFDTPLRTLDSLHLAVALMHRQRLWTTDKLLAQAARSLRIPYRLIKL